MEVMKQPENLIAVIKQVKPTAALFTTFTISLSFIDAVLLPTLRSVGCRDIFVLADADQLQLSLEEAESPYAGRHYWVAPVSAPGGGCFHPKLSYLQCSEVDVLTVGSGNLTQTGQSSQLECLDVVTADAAPYVFKQFSEFCSALADRVNGTSKLASEFLHEFSQRSLSASTSHQPRPQQVRLLHTLEEAASTQVSRLWSEVGDAATKLTVLAPFHAPDAGPVRRLASELGVAQVDIGLSARTLIAPFQRSRLGDFKATYVTPACENADRVLHAKVLAVSGQENTVVLTGSVNATIQSLETTENVEVAIARWNKPSAFTWETATPKTFIPNDYSSVAANQRELYVEATLDAGRIISGSASSRHDHITGQATAALLCSGRILTNVHCSVTQQGRFSFACTDDFEVSSAIQLELKVGERRGACWLNVAEDLRSTDAERRERQAIKRILEGRFDEQDVFELLGILTRAARADTSGRHPAPNESGVTTPQQRGESQGSAKFSYQTWSASFGGSYPLLGNLRNSQAVDALVTWLNRTAAAETSVSTPQPANPQRSFRDVVEEDSQATRRPDIAAQFETLLSLIPSVLSSAKPPPGAGLLAKVAGASAAILMLRGAESSPWPVTRVCSWLDEYSRFQYATEERRPLTDFAFAVATMAVAVARHRGVVISLSAIKEALSRFEGTSEEDLSDTTLRESLAQPTFKLAGPELHRAALEARVVILNARTSDEVLISFAKSVKAGEDVPPSAVGEFPGLLVALTKLKRSKPVSGAAGGVLVTEREVSAGGCYHCGLTLGAAGAKQLRDRHFVVCKGCGKPTFYLQDQVQASALREALRHA